MHVFSLASIGSESKFNHLLSRKYTRNIPNTGSTTTSHDTEPILARDTYLRGTGYDFQHFYFYIAHHTARQQVAMSLEL